MPAAERLGAAADEHRLFVAHHAHLAGSPAIYEHAMSDGKFAAANLDIGHFVAGNYGSPLPFMRACSIVTPRFSRPTALNQ